MAMNGYKTDLEADIIRLINQNQLDENHQHIGSMTLKELLSELIQLEQCSSYYYSAKQQRALKKFQNSPIHFMDYLRERRHLFNLDEVKTNILLSEVGTCRPIILLFSLSLFLLRGKLAKYYCCDFSAHEFSLENNFRKVWSPGQF